MLAYYSSSREFIGSFGDVGDGDGEFNDPEGVAVDDTTGALYNTNNIIIIIMYNTV